MIRSLSHAEASLVRSLRRRRGRGEAGAFLVEGERALTELAGSDAAIRLVLGTEDRLPLLSRLFPSWDIAVVRERDRSIFATEHAQGAGAVVEIPPYQRLEGLVALAEPVLYFDRIADPGNAGTIIRSADWFGLSSIALSPESVDPFNPKAVRASMGALFRARIAIEVSPDRLFDAGVPVIALDAGGDERLGEKALPAHAIFVIGSEAHGVDPAIVARASTLAIPGSTAGESLNAAMAATVLIYELFRQKRS